MDKSKYQSSRSFYGKTRIVLVLLGIFPFFLVIYLFTSGKLVLSDTILLLSALTLFSILLGFTLLRRSADQLVTLSEATHRVESGETERPIQIEADEEIKDIARHFNTMALKFLNLEKHFRIQTVQLMNYAKDFSQSHQKSKEEEELRNRLSRYVGENLVDKLIHSRKGAFPENERKQATVLYADIRSFTSISEKMPPEKVISMLNEFFNSVVEIIFQNNGILDKFVGDQIMAVFGTIPSDNSGPYDAVQGAIEMMKATENLMKTRKRQHKQTFEIGIGINTGNVIMGNIGAQNRMDYTVIGDSVNTAARLQQMARGGEIIIGEQTYAKIKGRFRIEKKGAISVKNKKEPVICYNIFW